MPNDGFLMMAATMTAWTLAVWTDAKIRFVWTRTENGAEFLTGLRGECEFHLLIQTTGHAGKSEAFVCTPIRPNGYTERRYRMSKFHLTSLMVLTSPSIAT